MESKFADLPADVPPSPRIGKVEEQLVMVSEIARLPVQEKDES